MALAAHDIYRSSPSHSGVEANISVAADVLVETIGTLRGMGYRFVNFGEFMAEHRGGAVVLLTFDDGYRSFRDCALPLLTAQGIPTVITLVSGALRCPGDPFPLWLHTVRDHPGALEQAACAPFVSHPHVRRVVAASGFPSLRDLLAQPLGVPSEAFRTSLTHNQLEELAEIVAGIPDLGRVTMTEADIKGLSGLIEFGAQSVTHRSFALLTNREIELEVTNSAASISELSGKPAGSLPFVYPYGAVTTYAERVVRSVFRAGFTCHSRPLTALDHASSFPRINLDGEAIRNATSGGAVADLLSLAREKLKLHARTGPAWVVLGPIRNAVRRLGRSV
ncbi:MAG: hypothetical protein NT159_25105 [Proteobacteria bacterium]|nr:hypothetical protein [Pseudomonadota bacterium]